VGILFHRSFRILVVVFVAWGLYNLTESRPFKVLSKRYRLDPILAGFLVKAVKAVIVALAVVMIIQQLGYNVSGVIAGLGLADWPWRCGPGCPGQYFCRYRHYSGQAFFSRRLDLYACRGGNSRGALLPQH